MIEIVHKAYMKLIHRFALYGFLKELKFFEPFIMLYFVTKGYSFFEVGVLFGFQTLCVNMMEIPSGVLADVYGRKTAMICSFCAYIVAFALLGWG